MLYYGPVNPSIPGAVTPYIPLMPIIGAPISKPEAVAAIASKLVVNFILDKKIKLFTKSNQADSFYI